MPLSVVTLRGRVHAHVDELPAPGDVALQHRGERAHRPRTALAMWKAWFPPPRTGGMVWSS